MDLCFNACQAIQYNFSSAIAAQCVEIVREESTVTEKYGQLNQDF